MATEENTPKAYTILETKQFQKDLQRLTRSGRYNFRKLHKVIDLLSSGGKLPAQLRNHELKGELAGREECHIGGE